MSFLRHRSQTKVQKGAQIEPPLLLTFLVNIKLSLVGCSPAEPISVLLDNAKIE